MTWTAAHHLPRTSRPDGFRRPRVAGPRNKRRAQWTIVPHKLLLPVAPTPVLSWWGPVLSAVLLQMLSEQPTSKIWWAGKWRTLQGGVNTPTLVQASQSPSTYDGGSPGPGVGGIDHPLPNLTLGGNCVIATISWAVTGGVTLSTPTDDGSNTYTVGKANTGTAGFTALSSHIALNVNAGTQEIRFRFAGGTPQFVCTRVSEWYNIATSSALDSAGSTTENTGGTSVWAAGSFTTGTAGDLIYQCASDNSGGLRGAGMTTSGAFQLLSTDLGDSITPEQYEVQASAGAVNPTITVPDAGGYISVAFALKAAAAGTAPNDAGGPPRIIASYGFNTRNFNANNPNVLQFPCSGNLLVLTLSQGATDDANRITSVTDTAGNTWVKSPSTPVISPSGHQFMYLWYAANATTSNTLKVSIHWLTDTTGINSSAILRDITNASTTPFDVEATASFNQTVHADYTLLTMTPAGAKELIIILSDQDEATIYGFVTDGLGHLPLFEVPVWQNPIEDESGTGGCGAIYTTDSCWGHFSTVDSSPVTFIETYSAAGGLGLGNGSAVAVAFLALPSGITEQEGFQFRADDGHEMLPLT